MKYNNQNIPMICMQTNSKCYKNTVPMEVLGILWHSTGANNPNLKRYIQPADNAPDKEEMLKILGVNIYKNDQNHKQVSSGLNAWIGKLADGTITAVQSMPWNYRPWGCGSGKAGSCNDGWIQFEICESDLNDKDYFNAVYKEACELTAYLCSMFNLDPNGTVLKNNIEVPVILCHADAHKLQLGSNHGDVNHWFSKHGKTMNDVRKDVAALLPKKEKPEEVKPVYYRVRKDWEDKSSQIGAYTSIDNAKRACDKAGEEYFVFDESGNTLYPEKAQEAEKPESLFNVGDPVKLISNATYSSGKSIPNWVKNSKLYVRQIKDNGSIIISTQVTGPITGTVKPNMLIPYTAPKPTQTSPTFVSYLVKITASALNVRAGAGTKYKVTEVVRKNEIHTIVEEKNGWGKLKRGTGWISLKYTKKI